MKVRIVKCTENDFWYKDQIGSILSCKLNNHGNYDVIGIGGTIMSYDCEILEHGDPKPEPFDLERALNGEKVITMDGRIVDEVIHVKSMIQFPLKLVHQLVTLRKKQH
jgi:hypothetical protein